jgi:hypothetical protein
MELILKKISSFFLLLIIIGPPYFGVWVNCIYGRRADDEYFPFFENDRAL